MGPLALVTGTQGGGYPAEPSSAFEASSDEAERLKVLAVIIGTEPVTVSLPERITTAALSYDPNNFNKNQLVFGQRAVRFEPCDGSSLTQFNGSFLTTEPICLPFEVMQADGSKVRGAIELGASCELL